MRLSSSQGIRDIKENGREDEGAGFKTSSWDSDHLQSAKAQYGKKNAQGVKLAKRTGSTELGSEGVLGMLSYLPL